MLGGAGGGLFTSKAGGGGLGLNLGQVGERRQRTIEGSDTCTHSGLLANRGVGRCNANTRSCATTLLQTTGGLSGGLGGGGLGGGLGTSTVGGGLSKPGGLGLCLGVGHRT